MTNCLKMSLTGKICLVTGASRGIGKGIALQLASTGATIYVTGRSQTSLNDCANEIKNRGGIAVPIQVDHSDDTQVKKLFDTIKSKEGRLDVLVNNAYAGVSLIMESGNKKFWETDPVITWDTINGVGLRNHYICTAYASRIMVEQMSGLIVNISSYGGLKYLFNCSYGIGKAAMDRMAADCAIELSKKNVAMVSLWPGPVLTEEVSKNILDNPHASLKEKEVFNDCETTEFPGIAIRYLMADKNIMSKTGKILQTRKLAKEYGFCDINGTNHADLCEVKVLLKKYHYHKLAAFVPSFFKIPLFILHMAGNKF